MEGVAVVAAAGMRATIVVWAQATRVKIRATLPGTQVGDGADPSSKANLLQDDEHDGRNTYDSTEPLATIRCAIVSLHALEHRQFPLYFPHAMITTPKSSPVISKSKTRAEARRRLSTFTVRRPRHGAGPCSVSLPPGRLDLHSSGAGAARRRRKRPRFAVLGPLAFAGPQRPLGQSLRSTPQAPPAIVGSVLLPFSTWIVPSLVFHPSPPDERSIPGNCASERPRLWQ
jgi:hypothetical protein